MYSCSEEYIKAAQYRDRTQTITGTLTTVDGVKYELNDKTFIKDTLYVTNQCYNNSGLEIGTVYAAECGLVLNSSIDRYTLFDAKIVLYNHLLVSGEMIATKIGEFYVDESTRIGNRIKLTSLDNMHKFDKNVDEDTNGEWIHVLEYICIKCGVELAQTEDELIALHPNTADAYTIKQDRVSTYRDVLSALCKVVCAFATMDRDGKLKILQYATEPSIITTRDNRLTNCSFSDYVTKYSKIKARFKADENYYPYTAEVPGDGLTYDLGDVPIVGGTPETKQALLSRIMNTLALIQYVPSTLYIPSVPVLELGDMIECQGVNNSDDTIITYVMAYKYEYRKKELIKSVGHNPRLQNVKTKGEREQSAIEGQIASKDLIVLNYTNTEAYRISQKEKCIVEISYTSNDACKPIFIATVPFSIEGDGLIQFDLYNGFIKLHTYLGYYGPGEHIQTLMYVDFGDENQNRNLRLVLSTFIKEDGQFRVIDSAFKATVEAISNTPAGQTPDLSHIYDSIDDTWPVVDIASEAIQAVVYTQGISAGVAWDGIIDVTDSVPRIAWKDSSLMTVEHFNASIESEMYDPEQTIITENFPLINTGSELGLVGATRYWSIIKSKTWGSVKSKTWEKVKEM